MKKALALNYLWLLLLLFVLPPLPSGGQASGMIGGEVHGSVYAMISDGQKPKIPVDPYIFLPDISVFLKNVKTSVTSPAVITDLDGTFMVPAQPQAEYQLCWKAPKFIRGCSDKKFVLRSRNVNLQPVGVAPQPGIILGRVALKDGSACRFVATSLGVNTLTKVTAALPSGKWTVKANNYGEYVLSGIPRGTTKITATCEGAQVSSVSNLAGSLLVNNLTLPNTSPIVQMAYATAGGRMVRSVAPGTTVQVRVQAKDGGGYPLHYRWAVDPPVKGFTSPDAPTVKWKVPGPGLATIYVLARDGKGGNVLSRVSLSTRPDRIVFSGRVTSNNEPLVAGADVTINGVVSQTNSQGEFALTLPKEEPRYVLTIEKPGYQLVSRALYAPVVGSTFRLYRVVRTFTINPTEGGEVAVGGREPHIVDVRILISPNSLAAGADGTGPLAASPLLVSPASYDIFDPENPLPGDFGGIDPATGKPYRLSTLGAVDVGIRDPAGRPFNLAPGKSALLLMKIHPALLASAPATIPFWHYDTKRGLWLQDGTATRDNDVYVVNVTHFSPVNMDLAFTDAACTRIVVDTGIMPVPFRLRMTVLTGGLTVSPDHQEQVISDSLNVVVREPPHTQVQFDVVDSDGNVVSAASQKIITGDASPSGLMWSPPPSPPYADCTSEVRYDVHTVQALFPAPPQGFLSFRTPPSYLDPVTAPALANAYYAKIDPGNTKTAPGDVNDFAHWKTANGFDRTGETRAIYKNEYDLGFGRDMHMQKGGRDGTCSTCIAYYVTNYPSVEDAVDGTNRKATVAMEYSPQNGISGKAYTKFYVFEADGSIANSVDLDGFGRKVVPTLCIVCHNGNINSMGPDGDLKVARFIPFDLQSFRYHPTNAAYFRSAQESQFRELNRGIIDHTNTAEPVRLLVSHWYGAEGDTTLPNLPFDETAVPSQWTSPTDESSLYNAVVKTSCRSCHTTRDPGDNGFGHDISWQSFQSLDDSSSTTRIFTCNPAGPLHHVMPQAVRTFARFWLSTNPNAPAIIAHSHLSGFQPPNNNNCN